MDNGKKMGRPEAVDDATVKLILGYRAQREGYRKIAQRLNQAGVPTAGRGREWYPGVVRTIVIRHG